MAQERMTFAQMMNAANGVGTAPMLANADLAPVQNQVLPFSLPDNTAAANLQPPQMYDHSAAYAGIPRVGGAINAEQMRHELTKLTQAVQGQGQPQAVAQEPVAAPLQSVAQGTEMVSPVAADPSSTRSLATGEIAQGRADMGLGTVGMMKVANDVEAGGRQELSGEKQLAAVKAAKSQEQSAIDNQAVELARQQEDKQRIIAEQGERAAQAQMTRVMAAAEEASQASVKDFWQDKSAGARVLGILSQAFAGAANGLAGNPSAPTPLDRVIQRDMELQLANLNQKNRKVENERSVLRDVYAQTGNSLQATAAMYVASWKRIELQGAQLNSKFGTQESQAGFEKLQGLVQQRTAQIQEKLYTNLRATGIQEAQHGMNLMAEDDRTGTMAAGSASPVGENAKIYHFAGTKGAVDHRTYTLFKDEDQNFRGFTKQAEHIDWLFKHGSGDSGNDWKDFNSGRSAMFATLRQMQKTGAALSDAELKNAEAMLPSLAEGEIPGLAWLTNARNQMKRIMATAARGHLSLFDKAIEGVELDTNDPRYGSHVRDYIRQSAEEQNLQRTEEAQ